MRPLDASLYMHFQESVQYMILNNWGKDIIWMKIIIPIFDLLQVIVKLFKQICHRKWHFSWYGVFCYVFFFARFFFFLAIINFWTSHFRMVQKFITSRSYVINGPSKRRVIVYTAPLHRVSKLEDFLPWIFLCDVIECCRVQLRYRNANWWIFIFVSMNSSIWTYATQTISYCVFWFNVSICAL